MGGPGGASQRRAMTFCHGPFFALFSSLVTTDPSPHVQGNSNACEGPNDNTPGQMTIRRANRQPSTQIDHMARESTTPWANRPFDTPIDHTACDSTTQRANRPFDTPVDNQQANRHTGEPSDHPAGQPTIWWANGRHCGPFDVVATQSTTRRANR